MKWCVTEPDYPPKLGKWTKNGPKTVFFELKHLVINLLNLFYNENLYYFLCSCVNHMFGKKFFPEIWAKMLSANQVSRFSNLQNRSVK